MVLLQSGVSLDNQGDEENEEQWTLTNERSYAYLYCDDSRSVRWRYASHQVSALELCSHDCRSEPAGRAMQILVRSLTSRT